MVSVSVAADDCFDEDYIIDIGDNVHKDDNYVIDDNDDSDDIAEYLMMTIKDLPTQSQHQLPSCSASMPRTL